MTTEKLKPLPALTGIRIFAAFYVVMLHTGAGFFNRHGAPQIIDNLLNNGYIAVSLFFILSGFILAYSYDGKIGGTADAVHFWEARFARIYPVYALSLALMLPFSRDLTLGDRFQVLAMVQTWVPGKLHLWGGWNFPAWSLSVEAFFYLCFPLLIVALARLKVGSLRVIAALLLAGIAAGNLARPMEQWPDAFSFVRDIPLPILRLPEFIAGMACGLVFLRSPRMRYSGVVATTSALAAIGFLCLHTARWTSLAVIPFALLLLSLAYQRGLLARFLSTRLLVLLGGASYAVYLLQLPIRIYTRLAIGAVQKAPQGLDAFLSPCILLIVSIAIFLYWEEPARKFLRKALGLRSRWKWPYLTPRKALDSLKLPDGDRMP